LAWCVRTANTIVNNDVTGTSWTGATKINACASQPCNIFSLVDTINPEVVYFKILTTWTNSLTKLSPTATITITCGNAYTITEQAAPTNPQYVPHNDASVGFIMPVYVHAQ